MIITLIRCLILNKRVHRLLDPTGAKLPTKTQMKVDKLNKRLDLLMKRIDA
jgi:hypothetical protein